MQAASNKEKESQAAKEWEMIDGANPAAAGTTVSVAAEDLHMSAVPKRVVQLADIIAVRLFSPYAACAVNTQLQIYVSLHLVQHMPSGACVL